MPQGGPLIQVCPVPMLPSEPGPTVLPGLPRRFQSKTQGRTQTLYPPEALLILQTGYFSDCVLFSSLGL